MTLSLSPSWRSLASRYFRWRLIKASPARRVYLVYLCSHFVGRLVHEETLCWPCVHLYEAYSFLIYIDSSLPYTLDGVGSPDGSVTSDSPSELSLHFRCSNLSGGRLYIFSHLYATLPVSWLVAFLLQGLWGSIVGNASAAVQINEFRGVGCSIWLKG